MYLAIGNKLFHAGIGSFLSRVIAQGGHRFYMWRRHSRVAQPLMRTLLLAATRRKCRRFLAAFILRKNHRRCS